MKCLSCYVDKPIEEFCKDKHTKSGLAKRCRKCYSKKAKEWYSKNAQRQLDLARTPKQRFLYGQKLAKRRNLEWQIEESIFNNLINKPCHYCNEIPVNRTGVGLDRLDNNKGYSEDNVVPCCGRCNTGRSDNFSPAEWRVMIEAYLKFKLEAPTGIDPVSPS